MKIALEKSSGRAICRNQNCQKNPEHISETGTIKSGTLCAVFTMESAAGWNRSFYCRDCIDELYKQMRMTLDSKLWCLH